MLRVVEAVHRTDVGRQREANEDSLFSRSPVFAVADGMGGAQAGEVASRMAVAAFESELNEDAANAPETWLRETVRRANSDIFEFAQRDTARSGMGTTLTAALVEGDEVSFGHVGDSRAYLFRDGELSQLTNDHSLVEELRRQGKLTKAQAAEHPQRSVITRALGPEPDVAVDTMTVQARPGDIFLICSDGLTTMVGDEGIAQVLAQAENLDVAARKLIRDANEQGGRDNITVILFRVGDPEAADESEDAPAALPTEDVTLVGASADEAGLSAENVRAEAAAQRARMQKPIAVPSGRAQKEGPWRGRIVGGIVALLVVLALGFGAWYGAKQVYFLGTDEGGRVALFQGLPYELPFGVELYSEVESRAFVLASLPEERREVAVNHELRSEDDARDLLNDLEIAAREETTVTDEPPTGTGTGGGGQGTESGAGTGSGTGDGGGGNTNGTGSQGGAGGNGGGNGG
jgi:serine/threonine protein phosphatase PrpC